MFLIQILDFSALTNAYNQVQLRMANKISDVVQNTTDVEDIIGAVDEMLSAKCVFQSLPPGSSYYYQTYEEAREGTEYGDRVRERVAACGRKMLKLSDNNLPYYGGKTYFPNGEVTPEYYDVREQPYV